MVRPVLPVARAEQLKMFYRIIENDERMSAVLKHTPCASAAALRRNSLRIAT
jgi:hypothetical protein